MFLSTSCGNNSKYEQAIDAAGDILSTNSDSALQLLDNVLFPENLNEEYYNKYVLLTLRAKDKSNLRIKDDSVIFGTAKYYKEKGDMLNAARSAFYSARVLTAQNKKEMATQAYSEAEHLAAKTDDLYMKAQIQTFMGLVYESQLLTDNSIECFKKAAQYFKESDDNGNLVETYSRIANSFLIGMESDSAFFYYNQALALAVEHNYSDEQAHILNNLGVAYLHIEKYQQARNNLFKSIDLHKNELDRARPYLSIAISFAREQKRDSALAYINKITFDKEKKDPKIQANIAKTLAEVEAVSGNYRQALVYKDQYIKYLSGVFFEKNKENIADIQKKYNYEQTRTENHALTISRQRYFIAILFLGIGLIIFVMIFIRNRQKYKDEKQLAEEKIYQLMSLADTYNKKNNSMRDIILDHFNIFKKTALMETYLHDEEKKQNQKLLAKFNETVYGQDSFDWEKTYQTLDHIYDGFCQKLREAHPELDELDFRICCLTYANLSNTDISIIIDYKVNSVQSRKYALRKKFDIDSYGNLIDYLNKRLFGKETEVEIIDEDEGE
ncbi:hypothetical protein D0T66_03860 [Dysgonomonas sp. 25]|nr:hypothetical protein [Dysgonomonas sp. 25]